MKKALLLLGMIAAGAASGGVVAWSILSPAEKNGTHVVTPQSGAVSDDPFSQAGTHFTSYQAEQYPDLTYAAENAVKAVVKDRKSTRLNSSHRLESRMPSSA